MPFFISDECTGCTACVKKCPATCIAGERKQLHSIDSSLCIDCGVCALYCPVDAIQDPTGALVQHVKASAIPKAAVVAEDCTGCQYCIDICPFDCISLAPAEDGGFFEVAVVDQKKCVSCKLCETVCAKDAIYVERGSPFLTYRKTG